MRRREEEEGEEEEELDAGGNVTVTPSRVAITFFAKADW